MTITLLAISLNEHPLSQPITASFDANGGTIGRADHNTMALPDPERHISRLQAEIVASGPSYLIKNVGAANPIIVAGRSLGQGESAPLADRDQIRIGGYLLQVVLDGEDDSRGLDITRGRAAITAGTFSDYVPEPRPGEAVAPITSPRAAPAPAIGGLADFGTPLSSSNPFADLMGGQPPAPPPALAPTPMPPPAPVRPTTFAPPSGDTFADLMMPAPAGVRPGSAALGGLPAAAPAARLPDDFDPFAAPPVAPPRPAPPLGGLGGAGGGAFDDLIPNPAPSSIDDAFGLRPGASGRDPLADFMAGLPATPAGGADRAAPPAAQGLPTDPLALFGGSDSASARAAAAPSAADHTPDLMASFVPPGLVPPAPMAPAAAAPAPNPVLPTRFDWQAAAPASAAMPAPMPAPAPVRPPVAEPPHADIDLDIAAPAAAPLRASPAASRAAAGGAAPDALWAAFCQGAGIPPGLAPGLDEDLMRTIGATLRSAVDGTLQLIAVRATTKQELRAAVTVIQQRGNNPLKFSPDATTGIEQLLRPTMRGFLSGPEAMTDAMHDLVGHAIGTVAGMRAALDGMLGRFAPGELESKLVGKSLLDSVLPMNRKAKLWELYLQHFEAIREEAQEDFHSLFGKAFLAAYEQQLERLKREGNPG